MNIYAKTENEKIVFLALESELTETEISEYGWSVVGQAGERDSSLSPRKKAEQPPDNRRPGMIKTAQRPEQRIRAANQSSESEQRIRAARRPART